jgi:hypothetical protein
MSLTTMNQSDIDCIIKLLFNAIKHEDWDDVSEALEYMMEFQDTPTQFEEE